MTSPITVLAGNAVFVTADFTDRDGTPADPMPGTVTAVARNGRQTVDLDDPAQVTAGSYEALFVPPSRGEWWVQFTAQLAPGVPVTAETRIVVTAPHS